MASTTYSKTFESWTLAAVWGGVDHREWDASSVEHNMALRRARPSLIRRTRAGLLAPPRAAALAESKEAHSRSIWSASPKRSKSL